MNRRTCLGLSCSFLAGVLAFARPPVEAALVPLTPTSGSRGATIYGQQDFGSPLDDDRTIGTATVSGTSHAELLPDGFSHSGDALTTTVYAPDGLSFEGDIDLVATSESIGDNDVNTISNGHVDLFFTVTTAEPVTVTWSVDIAGNSFTPSPLLFFLADPFLTTYYYQPATPDPNGSGSGQVTLNLATGNYALYADLAVQAIADADNVGPNTSTGTFSFSLAVPEPTTLGLLGTASLLALSRRR